LSKIFPIFMLLTNRRQLFLLLCYFNTVLTHKLTTISDSEASGLNPRVYVYDLPEFWDLKPLKLETLRTLPAENSEIFGTRCEHGLHNEFATHMYSAPIIMLWRLLRSSQYRTFDPKEADLFYVPMWPKQKSQKAWESRCDKNINLEVERRLKYLNEETAHRHFFIVGKGHVKVGGKCNAWWKNPTGLLRRAMRFAYSSDYGTSNRTGQERYGPYVLENERDVHQLGADVLVEDRQNSAYPHLISIPYPSSIHVSRQSLNKRLPMDWIPNKDSRRKVLVSFVGGAHTQSTFAAPRKRLRQDCAKAEDGLCEYFNYNHANGVFTCGLHNYMSNATFCFQPGGDSPYRKSLYDSFLVGCIPVIFSQYNAFVAPWHFWSNHRINSMVVLNATAYVSGEFDVLAYLASIDPVRIRKIQGTIAQHAHRLQYALDDYPDDAIDIILRGAWHMAKTRELLTLFPPSDFPE